MPTEEKFAVVSALTSWFKKEKRTFPWRDKNCSAYGVWVSEVMLQQTRAEVVIPYFLQWMELFPNIASLAAATEREVMKAWEGLGYYSRARRLWNGAKFLMANKEGALPSSCEDLLEIPGFGPYTSGAVSSFAFHQKAVAVDGNVMRVISRLFAIEDMIENSKVQETIRGLTLRLLPDKEPWVAMEALIELGALVCKKEPRCDYCPIQTACEAKKRNIERQLPRKKKRPRIEFLLRDVVILVYQQEVLIQKTPEGLVMAGLHEFPYFERGTTEFKQLLHKRFPIQMSCIGALDSIDHSFTKFHARLFPSIWECEEKQSFDGYFWSSIDELETLPFSSGHRKILQFLQAVSWQR